jgi:fructokinase
MPISYSFGEVLYDCFENERLIGGAPLNFAWNLRQFGFPVGMVSAVGDDELGTSLRSFIRDAGINDLMVSVRPEPTGTVLITVAGGEPDFVINENVAWDHIDVNSGLEDTIDLVYFGSVAQRTPHNRNALRKLLEMQCDYRLFDVNIRQHYYSTEVLLDGIRNANIVKFNFDEWRLVRDVAEVGSLEELREEFELVAVASTRGSHGAELVMEGGSYHAGAAQVQVVDTVGAGDAFSAALAAGIMRGANPQLILDTACKAGALVVQQAGAHAHFPQSLGRSFSLD